MRWRSSSRGTLISHEHPTSGTVGVVRQPDLGKQVHRIPANADLSTLTSVSIWCERFDVSFGAAELVPTS